MRSRARRRCRIAAVAGWTLAAAGAGCVDNAGLLVIAGNQIPMFDPVSMVCTAAADSGSSLLGQGTLDLDVGTPQAYVGYPMVENRLQPRGATAGVEPNRIMLDGFRITLHPPLGFVFPWTDTVPDHTEPAFSQGLEPGASLTAKVNLVTQNQAQLIYEQFKPGGLSAALTDQVIFTVEMHAVGELNGGQIESDVFRFPVRMCTGCLQTGFTTLAQFNYPGLPTCKAAPRPNMYKGNPCNFAQDSGPLLCCEDEMTSKRICPAPDQ